MTDHPPKVIVTKIGFDGHDRGSRIVAAFLRDAGMEVIYTPPWQEVATVVKLAIEEDAEVIGISSLATDHLLVPRLMAALREAGSTTCRSSSAASCPRAMKSCCSMPALRACFILARRSRKSRPRFARCRRAHAPCEAASCNRETP